MKSTLTFLLISLILPSFSQQSSLQRGLYGSMNMGVGVVNRNFGTGRNSSARFCMYVSGGWFIVKQLQIGITANGWTYHPADYNVPEDYGQFISTDYVHLQVYPFTSSGLYVKGGYGGSLYINEHDSRGEGRGRSYFFSAGYEIPFKKIKKTFWGLEVSYHNGNIKDKIIDGVLYNNRYFHAVDFTAHLAVD
jgi:hypothetical protein